MAFVHHHAPHAIPAAEDRCLVIQGDLIAARWQGDSAVELPTAAALASAGTWPTPVHVGLLAQRPCWLVDLVDAAAVAPASWSWLETRALLGVLTDEQVQAIACARQLAWWDRRHRFCGACGTPTVIATEERARRCPQCSAVFFPAVSPAVVVAVTRGDELLLAHNRNFRPGMFSLLAGFVDPGETLEQTVVREVREEVGIEVAELRYVASQPWPFPNSLMIGFRARHTAGEIAVDGKEIEAARWFRREALPDVPRVGTVARRLIDAWLRETA